MFSGERGVGEGCPAAAGIERMGGGTKLRTFFLAAQSVERTPRRQITVNNWRDGGGGRGVVSTESSSQGVG
jgi:hypothetical protein